MKKLSHTILHPANNSCVCQGLGQQLYKFWLTRTGLSPPASMLAISNSLLQFTHAQKFGELLLLTVCMGACEREKEEQGREQEGRCTKMYSSVIVRQERDKKILTQYLLSAFKPCLLHILKPHKKHQLLMSTNCTHTLTQTIAFNITKYRKQRNVSSLGQFESLIS